jgi:sigma-B regulation protein RsbU (phosphoserine phosphatase)
MGAIESIRDITDLRRTEQMLEKSRSELRIASDIQRNFLPEQIPSISGLDLAAVTIPAKEVGGDFYDFIIEDENLHFAIADVSGKGVPAALFMVLSRTIVRACATIHASISERLYSANNMIIADSRSLTSGMFVTLFFASLNKRNRSLIFANAGHNPPLLFRAATNNIEMMEVNGVALGMGANMEYGQRQLALQPGDILFLYTDGVVEAMNNKEELFGLNALRSSLLTAKERSAQEILDSILHDLKQFTNGEVQSDDITAIVIKVED